MILQYKLSIAEKSTRGALQNVTPLILDSKQDCEIFFYLSNGKTLTGDYYVSLTDSLQQTTRLQIIGSKITLPKKFWREQEIKVRVDLTSGGKITRSWYCQPLRLAFLDNAEKAALTIGADLYGALERVATLENGIAGLQETVQAQGTLIEGLTAALTEIQERYNQMLAVVTDMDSRLKIIENE